jgi:acetate---CoA ligase (ADP-forming)
VGADHGRTRSLIHVLEDAAKDHSGCPVEPPDAADTSAAVSSARLAFFHAPRSVAVVGASDNPDKIGGRPIRYLRDFGFTGAVLPVNPHRHNVQGVRAYGDLAELPAVPDVAVIALAGQAAVDAVGACADMGVRGCVVMAAGFGETSDPLGQRQQQLMLASARAAGMRLVGPNSQGLASFATGAVLSFSTMFIEQPPLDGPVAVISQSGAMSSVPYGLLRRRGLGVRYAHATGNDADVSVGELTEAVLADEYVRLVLVYLEAIRHPESLERAARLALTRGVPLIALVGGRTAEGKRAALSHTGALASERRVVDAFLRRCGIWQARCTPELVAAAELYLKPWQVRGRRLAIVSNSGAVCVLGADAAVENGLQLARLSETTSQALTEVLPAFASTSNPVDVTAALLTDSTLFGKVLPPIGSDPGVDGCLVGIPVSGRGYDVERIAADIAAFTSAADMPVLVSTPQPDVGAVFRTAGLAVFEEEASAVAAVAQLVDHQALMTHARTYRSRPALRPVSADGGRPLSEWQALGILRQAGIATADTYLCGTAAAAADAFVRLGGGPVAVKGCPSEATHKSELGLVRLGIASARAAAAAALELLAGLAEMGMPADGVLVAPMVAARIEVLVGAHVDPVFGPVVVIGAGGRYVEITDDVELLLPPFDVEHATEAITRLAIAPRLAGVRGEPPADIEAWALAAVRLGQLMLDDDQIVSVDINPLMLGPRAEGGGQADGGAVAVDAVVVARPPCTQQEQLVPSPAAG